MRANWWEDVLLRTSGWTLECWSRGKCSATWESYRAKSTKFVKRSCYTAWGWELRRSINVSRSMICWLFLWDNFKIDRSSYRWWRNTRLRINLYFYNFTNSFRTEVFLFWWKREWISTNIIRNVGFLKDPSVKPSLSFMKYKLWLLHRNNLVRNSLFRLRS